MQPSHDPPPTPVAAAAPIVELLRPAPVARDVFRQWAHLPHCIFLDSARRDPLLGRYSFVAADPFDYLELPVDAHDPLLQLAQQLEPFAAMHLPELPPFQGGAAGLLGYELARSLERLPAARYDEFQVPALAVGMYDLVVAFDHVTDRAWIVSQGFPEVDPDRRRRRAEDRLRQARQWLDVPIGADPGVAPAGRPEAGHPTCMPKTFARNTSWPASRF